MCFMIFRATVKINTIGTDCSNLGGSPNFGTTTWGDCVVDLCEADHPDNTVFVAARIGTCEGSSKKAYGILNTLGEQCSNIGGAMNSFNSGADEDVQCYLDWCHISTSKTILLTTQCRLRNN